ncbi:hypothetical protein GF318_03320 [Candidatus Micrarchaeota archaeon]|nr:hypothetical protein [Candidatus Micrarchaeota archaeon]
MNWRPHAVIGGTLALAVLYFLGTGDVIELIVIAFFGAMAALVPDIDHHASKGKEILDLAFISVAFFLVYFSNCGSGICIPNIDAVSRMALIFFAFLGVYFLFFRFFKPAHRGVTHTLAACAAFGILAFLFTGEKLGVAGFLGYFSHLAADQHIKLI